MAGHGDIPNPRAWIQGPLLSGVVDPVLPQIVLTWVTPSSGYFQFNGYTVFRSDNGGGFTAIATGLSALTYTDASLVSGHSYTYYVAPVWADGEKAPSNQITIAGVIYDLFLASGTWNLRSGVRSVIATVIGAGGAGSSGTTPPIAGESEGGGQGGGGGAFAQATFSLAQIGTTKAVTVGTGGTGGVAIGGTNSSPNLGSAGGGSSFGSLLLAGGGSATGVTGLGSNVPGGTATNPGGGTVAYLESGGIGGPTGTTHSDNVARAGGATTFAGAGGGGGSRNGTDASNVSLPVFNNPGGAAGSIPGGTAGTSNVITAGAVTGTYNAAPGNPGVTQPNPPFVAGGSGGGGGGLCGIHPDTFQACLAIGGNGGLGGGYGGGGGGGGDGVSLGNKPPNVQTSGAGGNGAPGVVQVANYFW